MKNKEEVFVLPNKTIEVKFIPRKVSLISNDNNHIAKGGMLEGASMTFYVPLQRNGNVKNILTASEKNLLEEMTGLNLSSYSDFWDKFSVRIYKDGNKFDLSNPNDYISYKLLLAHDSEFIAPSWKDRNKLLSYRFAIVEDEEMVIDKNKKYNLKKEAFKIYSKIENNREMLVGVLRLLENKPVSDKTSIDRIQERVLEYVDKDTVSFMSVVQDDRFETKALLLDAVSKGIIKKTGNRYVTTEGLDLCESGEIPLFNNAVSYLESPKNQEIKSMIEAKVLKSKK